jgi:hypothetical protein
MQIRERLVFRAHPLRACEHGLGRRLSKQWDFIPKRIEGVIGPQRDAGLSSLGNGDLIFYCIELLWSAFSPRLSRRTAKGQNC